MVLKILAFIWAAESMENNNSGGVKDWMDCKGVSVYVNVKENVQVENMDVSPHQIEK